MVRAQYNYPLAFLLNSGASLCTPEAHQASWRPWQWDRRCSVPTAVRCWEMDHRQQKTQREPRIHSTFQQMLPPQLCAAKVQCCDSVNSAFVQTCSVEPHTADCPSMLSLSLQRGIPCYTPCLHALSVWLHALEFYAICSCGVGVHAACCRHVLGRFADAPMHHPALEHISCWSFHKTVVMSVSPASEWIMFRHGLLLVLLTIGSGAFGVLTLVRPSPLPVRHRWCPRLSNIIRFHFSCVLGCWQTFFTGGNYFH